jgi:hypothetical protein
MKDEKQVAELARERELNDDDDDGARAESEAELKKNMIPKEFPPCLRLAFINFFNCSRLHCNNFSVCKAKIYTKNLCTKCKRLSSSLEASQT